jgi:hypothetical protein
MRYVEILKTNNHAHKHFFSTLKCKHFIQYRVSEHFASSERRLRLSSCSLGEVKFQVHVFWVVTHCSVVVGYQRFRDP